MALQTHPDQAWPPLLQQLQEAQRLHLSATKQPLESGRNANTVTPLPVDGPPGCLPSGHGIAGTLSAHASRSQLFMNSFHGESLR